MSLHTLSQFESFISAGFLPDMANSDELMTHKRSNTKLFSFNFYSMIFSKPFKKFER